MKQQIKKKISEFALQIYKQFSPQGFPSGWDVASDIQRILDAQLSIQSIFDVGANVGEIVLYFNQKFTSSQILAFEPINESFKTLEKNTEHLKNVNCFKYALGSTIEKKTISLNPNSQQNSLVEELQKDSFPTEVIDIITLDNFCEQTQIEKIDLLKIDTEGFELEVLKGATNLLENRKISFILSEVGFRETDKRHTFFFSLYQFLYSKGFRFYGLYDLSYWIPNFHEGLMYCNALFVCPKALKNLK